MIPETALPFEPPSPLLETSHKQHRGPRKCPTGIRGLDEITGGGLPFGRPTLVCGGTGCGKTLLAIEFLVRGAVDYGEPAVFVTFEETVAELTRNVASLGYDLKKLIAQNLLFVDHVELAPIGEESGEFNLDGLFVRLRHAVERVKARRVVLDTIENLFAGFSNSGIVRAEVRRLFHWLKERRLTSVVTAERGDGTLTRQGIEEYVSDCVILLDHRVNEQLATRRLRVVKYRGTQHGTDEYPFLIDDRGIVVVPVTSLLLDQKAPRTFVSTGVESLDQMLGGHGYYSASTILVSGGAGTGKTSLAASFVSRACQRGSRAIYFAFEESQQQIVRGMASIGLDLQKHVDKGLLAFSCSRPTLYGLETHLAKMHTAVIDFRPKVAVIDPITDLSTMGTRREVHAMLTRLIDFLKTCGVTALLTGMLHDDQPAESAALGVSSLIDTWIQLQALSFGAERNRALFVRKARGMAHSNQIREFLIDANGIRLVDICVGPDGVLTGSARVAHRMRVDAEQQARQNRRMSLLKELDSRKAAVQARMAAISAELQADLQELESAFASQLASDSRSTDAQKLQCDIRMCSLPGQRAKGAKKPNAS